MAPVDGGLQVSGRRAELAGPSGIRGLLANRQTTAIAFFASLGGLVYGCKKLYDHSGRKICRADDDL